MEQAIRPVPIRPAGTDGGKAMRRQVLDRLGLTPFAVYVWIADEADGGEARVSYADAAAMLGVSRSTVLRAVRALVGAGFLEVLAPATTGRNGVNRYRLNGVTNGVTPPLQVVGIGVTNGVTNGVTAPPAPPVHVNVPVNEQEATTQEPPPPPSPAPSRTRPAYPEGFEAAWRAYPHVATRSDKRRSLAEWRRAAEAVGEEAVLAAIAAWRGSADWTKDDGQYVPGMQVWLAREGYSTMPRRARNAPPTVGPEPGAQGYAPATAPIPEGWAPGETLFFWARGQGFSTAQVDALAGEFAANARIHDRRAMDWSDKFKKHLQMLLAQGVALDEPGR